MNAARFDPLPPRPGDFHAVLANADKRRRRSLVASSTAAGLAVAIAGASFAVAATVGVPDEGLTDRPASHPVTHPKPSQGASTPKARRSSTPAPGGQRSRAAARGSGPAAGTPGGSHRTRVSYLVGRVVDSTGAGIGGIMVEPGAPGYRGFVTSGRVAAITDPGGYYRIACPHAPVLLATFRVNYTVAGASTGGDAAAGFVEGGTWGAPATPACGKREHVTTLVAGASVSGTFTTEGCDPGETYGMWLWLGGNRLRTVRLSELSNGTAFRVSGLPPGHYTLGVNRQTTSFDLSLGEAAQQDKNLVCHPATAAASTPPATPDASATP